MRLSIFLLFSILFLPGFLFAGSRWQDATRFSAPLSGEAISNGAQIYALTQDGLLYSISSTDATSSVIASLHSPTTVPLQKGRNILFAGTSDGTIYAYSLSTQQLVWQYPQQKPIAKPQAQSQAQPQSQAQAQGAAQNSSLNWLQYYDGAIYAVYGGRLVALSEQSGAMVFERKLSNGRCASADSTAIYVSGADSTSAYSKDGRLLWSATTGPTYKSCPTPIGSKVYVPTTRSSLLALNSQDGSLAWSYPVSGWLMSNPAGYAGSIIIAENGGNVLSLNSQTGKLNWQTQISGHVWASPKILESNGKAIAIFGTQNNSIAALSAQDGSLVFDYQVTDWVDSISIAGDARTILAATRDNSLWAIYASPICTIDYPRSSDIISQEITLRARAFAFSGTDSVQLIINSKPYPTKILGNSSTFEYDLDLSQEPLALVDMQCIATDSQGLRESDAMQYKTQPILSLGARKLNMSIQAYPKYPEPGQKFTVYIRNSQGYDTQGVLLEFMGKNYTASSPYELTAPASGAFTITARKAGYYPAQLQVSTRQDFGILPILGLILLAIIAIAAAVYFSKKKKK
ncbi:MAG: PQQ-binding-like beta-propeller repeat protein [Candidatus Micrarchaeota archaeon]